MPAKQVKLKKPFWQRTSYNSSMFLITQMSLADGQIAGRLLNCVCKQAEKQAKIGTCILEALKACHAALTAAVRPRSWLGRVPQTPERIGAHCITYAFEVMLPKMTIAQQFAEGALQRTYFARDGRGPGITLCAAPLWCACACILVCNIDQQFSKSQKSQRACPQT